MVYVRETFIANGTGYDIFLTLANMECRVWHAEKDMQEATRVLQEQRYTPVVDYLALIPTPLGVYIHLATWLRIYAVTDVEAADFIDTHSLQSCSITNPEAIPEDFPFLDSDEEDMLIAAHVLFDMEEYIELDDTCDLIEEE